MKAGIISFIFKSPSTPVLWSSDFTQQLSSFHQLAGMSHCLAVSDEVIACVYDQNCVKFFNVSTKQIVHKMPFDERDFTVHACSINYHVLTVHAVTVEEMLTGRTDDTAFLWKDGRKIDKWTNLFYETALGQIISAKFSPKGNTLALASLDTYKLFIFDVVSTSMLAQIPFSGKFGGLKFFDDKNLICGFHQTIYFINVEPGEILACLDSGIWPFPISICRKRSIVCAGLHRSRNFQLLEVILPRM